VKMTLATAYIVANYLKLIGGAASGLMVQLRRRSKPEPVK
jgi:hypothetical protein